MQRRLLITLGLLLLVLALAAAGIIMVSDVDATVPYVFCL
jgi:hypothetical protein